MVDTRRYFTLLVYSFLTTATNCLLRVLSETVGLTFCEELLSVCITDCEETVVSSGKIVLLRA